MACYAAYPRHSRQMNTIFPRFPVAEFSPLFRLLDDELTLTASRSGALRTWQPRFDVREERDAFHLNGELPGVDSKDLSIEFADDNTMVIKGHSVRERTSGNLPVFVDEFKSDEQVEQAPASDAASEADSSTYHKPTVEDEDFVDVAENKAEPMLGSSPQQAEQPVAQQQHSEAAKTPGKYWVSERSVGQFHRSFTFPGHVNQDAVSAKLNNGILNVIVPKAAPKEPRKITIA